MLDYQSRDCKIDPLCFSVFSNETLNQGPASVQPPFGGMLNLSSLIAFIADKKLLTAHTANNVHPYKTASVEQCDLNLL